MFIRHSLTRRIISLGDIRLALQLLSTTVRVPRSLHPVPHLPEPRPLPQNITMPFFDIPTYTACLRRQHATASGLVTGLTFSSTDDRLCALVSSGRLTVARTNYPDRATTTNGVPGYARALCAGQEGLYVAGDFGLLRTAWAGDKGIMLFPETRVQALVKGEEGVFAAVEGGWIVVIEEGERESSPVLAVGGEVEVGCLCALPEGGFLAVRLLAIARVV